MKKAITHAIRILSRAETFINNTVFLPALNPKPRKDDNL